jgi:hypothetical protein
LKKGLDGVIGEIILRSFGHGWCCWMFWLTPSRIQLWPDTSNPRRRASTGHRAGIVGLLCFYRQEVALALNQSARAVFIYYFNRCNNLKIFEIKHLPSIFFKTSIIHHLSAMRAKARTASSPAHLSVNLSANTLLLFNLRRPYQTNTSDWLVLNRPVTSYKQRILLDTIKFQGN